MVKLYCISAVICIEKGWMRIPIEECERLCEHFGGYLDKVEHNGVWWRGLICNSPKNNAMTEAEANKKMTSYTGVIP